MDNEVREQILGIVGMSYHNNYDANETYKRGYVVVYEGSSYVAKKTTKGNLPTNTNYFQLVARKPIKGTDYFTEQDKQEIVDEVTEDAESEFNQNAQAKTEAFNNNASSKTSDFNTNATAKTTAYDTNASDKLSAYNTNATSKTNDFNTNANDKVDEYNDNASDKTDAFDTHVEEKTDEFDNNAEEKTQEFNDNVESYSERLKNAEMVYNALPKVSAEGTEFTLDGTAECPMYESGVGATEVSQETTKGENNLPQGVDYTITTSAGKTITSSNGKYTLTGEVQAAVSMSQTISLKENYIIQENDYIHLFNNNYTIEILGYDSSDNRIFDLSANEKNKIISLNSYAGLTLAGFRFYVSSSHNNKEFELTPMIINNVSTATDYEPYTNGASPNPDYPQEIHTISGDNEVVVSNSIWNEKWEVGTYDNTGNKSSSSTQIRSKYYIPCLPNTTYYFLAPSGNRICFYNSNKEFISVIFDKQNTTFTTPNNAYYINFNMSTDYGATYNNNIGIYQETSGTYLPSQSYPINLPVGNLFDKDNATYVTGKILNDDGIETTSSANGYFNSYIPVKPNTQYTIQGILASSNNTARIYYYDNSKGWISRTATIKQQDIPYTFTTPSNCYYIGFSYALSTYDANTIQIEEGSKANSYTPFGTTPIEYCKIGDYEDEFFKNVVGSTYYDSTLELNKWYLKKRIGKTTDTIGSTSKTISDMVSNATVYSYCGGTVSGTTITYTSALLVANYIYYPTTTPTNILLNDTLQTQLDDIQKAISYQGQTNISQENNDLPFTLKFSAIRDLSGIFELISSQSEEI